MCKFCRAQTVAWIAARRFLRTLTHAQFGSSPPSSGNDLHQFCSCHPSGCASRQMPEVQSQPCCGTPATPFPYESDPWSSSFQYSAQGRLACCTQRGTRELQCSPTSTLLRMQQCKRQSPLQISNKALVAMLSDSQQDAQRINAELSQIVDALVAEGKQEVTQYVSVLQARHAHD